MLKSNLIYNYFLDFRIKMESIEEPSVSVKLNCFINMASKKEISWETLTYVVKDLTSTHEKA